MPKCANPLFLRWVKQFHDEKDYRKRGGPPRATGYENAIRALETCTKTYAHPADMRGKVSGVGPTTIERCVFGLGRVETWTVPELRCADAHAQRFFLVWDTMQTD